MTTASAIIGKVLTVDGAGSGIDADLLDGKQGSAYVLASDFGFPATGVFKFAGGFCIQWGAGAHGDNTGVKAVAWHARMTPLMAVVSNAAGGPPTGFHGTGNYTNDGMTVYSSQAAGVASPAGTAFTWIAIGQLL